MDEIRTAFARRDLFRRRQGKWVGGVCAGLGQKWGMSAKAARILFVVVLLVLPGSQFVVYPVLWVLMPREGTAPSGGATYA